jgi:hypothetical protein
MFGAMVALDFAWAIYNQATVNHQPWRASSLAAVIYVVGAIGVMNYSDNRWLLIPACAGAFVGTFIATKRAA